MRIMINFLGRTNSGPGFTYELADGFVKNGCEVYAILSNGIENKEQWISNKSIQTMFIDTYSGKKDILLNSIRFKTVQAKIIKKHYDEIKFDMIIRTFFHPWAEEIDKLLHADKIVTICHDPIPHSNEPWIKRVLYKNHIMKSDDIIVLTKAFIEIVHERYGFSCDHIHYMPHGMLHVGKRKSTLAVPYKDGNINFLFFGRIQPYKGLPVTAEAFSILQKRYTNISLYIVGSGDISNVKGQLDELENVYIFNKYIPDEDIPAYFGLPNLVCVLSYIDATQSGVIPVAFEYKIPVIASNTGGLYEQLDDGKLGLLFENGNAEEMALQMGRFINDPYLYQKEVKKIENYLPQLEWENITKRLLCSLGEA